MTRATGTAARDTSASTVRLFQVSSALSLLALLWQFATAGQMLSGNNALGAHGGGAIALHLTTGLTLVAAVLYLRRSGGARWPAALAGVVFVLTFLQAYLGDAGLMGSHIPGALAISVGVVWLLVWSLGRSIRL